MKKPERKNKYLGSMITYHGCENVYQDARYGEHQRVFNHAPGNAYKSPERWRCSACGRER